MPVTISGTNGVTFPDSSLQAAAASPYVLKNRIINGDMRIDQRNAGASISISNTSKYSVDRFNFHNVSDGVISAQQSTVAPNGFKNSMKITVTTADASVGATQYSFIRQTIEGYNVADMGFGAAGASTITVSFWVQSSVTGTFGGAIQNSAEDRAYAFTYTINVANTWEQKSVTITGDTTGTWLTTNGAGLLLNFSLGVGSTYSSTANAWAAQTSFNATGSVALLNTLNATFYITGVQLEIGTSATPFERRLYGQELLLCQRYFETFTSVGNVSAYTNYCVGGANSTTAGRFVLAYKVQKRSSASISFTTASGFSTQNGSDGIVSCTAITSDHAHDTTCQVTTTVASGLTAGASSRLISNNNNTSTISISAEL